MSLGKNSTSLALESSLEQRFGDLSHCHIFGANGQRMFAGYDITGRKAMEFVASEEIEKLPVISRLLKSTAGMSWHQLTIRRCDTLFMDLVCIGVLDKELLQRLSDRSIETDIPDRLWWSPTPPIALVIESIKMVLETARAIKALEERVHKSDRTVVDVETHERMTGAALCEKVIDAFFKSKRDSVTDDARVRDLREFIAHATHTSITGSNPPAPLAVLGRGIHESIGQLFGLKEGVKANHEIDYLTGERAMKLITDDREFMDRFNLGVARKALSDVERKCDSIILDARH